MAIEQMGIRNVTQHYGVRKAEGQYGGRAYQSDLIKTAVWDFDFQNLPKAETNNLAQVIPAGASILSAKLRILVGFTSTSGTTDLTVGLSQANGTAIDADGLITAAQATQTTIGTAGNVIDGASGTPAALLNVSIGANPGEVVVAPSVDDLTAGRALLIVEYLA